MRSYTFQIPASSSKIVYPALDHSKQQTHMFMISVPAFKSVSLICCGKHILNRSSYTQHLLSDWSFLNVYIQIRVLWLHYPNSVYWVEFKTLETERLATLSLATAPSCHRRNVAIVAGVTRNVETLLDGKDGRALVQHVDKTWRSYSPETS